MSGKQLAISHNFKDLDCCDLDFAISLRLALRDRHNLIIFCSSIKRMNYDLRNQQTPQPPAPQSSRLSRSIQYHAFRQPMTTPINNIISVQE